MIPALAAAIIAQLLAGQVLLAQADTNADAPADPNAGREQLEALRAQQAEREARQAELAEEAEAAAREAAGIQRDMVRIGEAVSELERDATAAETRLETLTQEEAAAAEALTADRAALIRVLAALQRAEMRKPPPLAVKPGDAAGAARAAALLGAIAPELEARADSLRDRIEELASLRAELDRERQVLAEAQAELDRQRAEMTERLDSRKALENRLRADAEQEADAARAIAEEAESLTNLIAMLEEQARAREEARRREEAERRAEAERLGRLAPPPLPPPGPLPEGFAEARGRLRPPAEGRIVTGFGAPREAGNSQGVSIATRARAQVVSPFDARVEFAADYGNYGPMLILSVGDGYHIILAGLDRLYAFEGQSVLAGEPLGEMADRNDPAPELYYEIRQDQDPIDPGPWIRDGARAG